MDIFPCGMGVLMLNKCFLFEAEIGFAIWRENGYSSRPYFRTKYTKTDQGKVFRRVSWSLHSCNCVGFTSLLKDHCLKTVSHYMFKYYDFLTAFGSHFQWRFPSLGNPPAEWGHNSFLHISGSSFKNKTRLLRRIFGPFAALKWLSLQINDL